ncbi:MAG TPA: hypothetical protein DCL21_02375 [Alphaproteobacteria bacterium]|nr:hypothetical protein [Alphaproteobacteria bacterium]
MVWTRAKNLFFVTLFTLAANISFAQESLWKTFNDFSGQEVPSYNGGLSPFPQKQKKIEELEFEQAEPVSEIEIIEADVNLTDQEKRLMLTTSILAEIKSFLEEEAVFVPNLDSIIVEATAKASGVYKALIKKRWVSVGDSLDVPVDEARDALDLLDRLREVDEQLAETVENAVLSRTTGGATESIKVTEITEDKVEFRGTDNHKYVVNFIKAPF